MKTRYDEIPAFVTKDGSEILELLHGSPILSLASKLINAQRMRPARYTSAIKWPA